MKPLTRWMPALALALLGASSPANASAPPTPPPSAPTDPITAALAATIAGKAPLDGVRVEVKWNNEAVPVEVRVFGTGVAIWDGRLQFRLAKPQVLSILETLQKARFGSMPDRFGGSKAPPGRAPLRLVGSIAVRVGMLQKLVAQVDRGDQSKEFAELANEILGICRGPGLKGDGAASLPDALRKLAAGQLAPETLEALVQRRTSRSEPGSPQDTWLLRLEGRTATSREMPQGKAPEDSRSLTLSAGEFEALIALLISNDVSSIPKNVYTAQYTDLRVEILNQMQSIVGRKFAGKDGEQESPRRQQFDRIYEAFRDLHERVEKEGIRHQVKPSPPAPTPAPTSPSPAAP